MRKFLGIIAATIAFSVAPLPNCRGAEPAIYKELQEHTRSLMGRVLTREDEPLAKAVVYLKNTKTLAVKTYITDPDGSYHFPGLSPNVDYEVHAEYNGARSDSKTLSAFDTRKQANITLRIK